MYIEKIKVENFRNYAYQELELKPGINILYGDNAQGKTNIMEAIYLCALRKVISNKKGKRINTARKRTNQSRSEIPKK